MGYQAQIVKRLKIITNFMMIKIIKRITILINKVRI